MNFSRTIVILPFLLGNRHTMKMNNYDLEDLDLFAELTDAKCEPGSSEDLSPVNAGLFDWESQDFDWSQADLPTTVLDEEKDCLNALPFEVVQKVEYTSDSECPSSPASRSSDDKAIASKHHTTLMVKYSLTDDTLTDSTLKALKRLCGSNAEDYRRLQLYRRTCLNRGYARSSRNKQQEKTTDLSVQLSAAHHEIAQLRKDVDDRDTRIKFLEIENEFLRCSKTN